MEKEQTIRDEARLSGIGLHSGERVGLVVRPASPGSGITFFRSDSDPPVSIPARSEHICGDDSATTLIREGREIGTVEHLLAAVWGMGIDNLEIWVDGPEVPAGDGSAEGFVDLLTRAGIVSQDRRRMIYALPSPCEVSEGNSRILASPGEGGLVVEARISYPDLGVAEQSFRAELAPEVFRREIAPARTYGFSERLAEMQGRGKARGGSLENAVLLREGKVVNPEGLRFPNELARHKVLDLIGDLALVGRRFTGRVEARFTGHAHHHRLVREIVRLLA